MKRARSYSGHLGALACCLLTPLFFALETKGAPPASRVYGYVRSGSAGLAGANVLFYDAQTNLRHSASTDGAGLYLCDNMSSGVYYVVAYTDGYAAEWYKNANSRDLAKPLNVRTNATISGCDFNLVPGQSPALVRVRSLPSHAVVYVDYHPVTNLTAALVTLGESVPRGSPQQATDPRWLDQASHTISARLPGAPLPSPQRLPGLEAGTCDDYFSMSLCEDYFVAGLCDDFHVAGICADYFIAGICADYFDFSSTNVGVVKILSSPPGAEAYLDAMDVPVGNTPVIVNNVLQGWHTIQLRPSGLLLPRPIRLFVVQGRTNELLVPLHAAGPGVTNLTAHITSVPPGATLYVDYLLTAHTTPAVITNLDQDALCGDRLYSVSHSFSLRKEGYVTTLPRYIRSRYPEPSSQHVNLVQSPAAIGDLVWFDRNTNGLLDVGEQGVSNVTVNLYDANTNWLQAASTDADGNYCFKGLTSGTYRVEVYPPYARAFTRKGQGTNGAIDSDVWPTTGRTDPVPLTWGEYDLRKDAGLKTNTVNAFWFRATALTNHVFLRWLPPNQYGMLTSNVLIRYRVDQYPTNTEDGLPVYSGPAPFHQHTGLTPSQTYYYSIWLSHNGVRFIEPP